MIAVLFWLAQEETVTLQEVFQDMTIDYHHLATFGSVFLVSVGVFIWAAFFRKPRRHRHHHPHHPPANPAPETRSESRKAGWFFFRKRHRHRHRHRELPRNPTLAEAGGLPPVRTQSPPPTST
jgi:hypothetical protein